MPCKLKNLTKQSQVFNLTHDSLRMAEGEFGYSKHLAGTTTLHADGEVKVRGRHKMLPGSITFLAGETKEGLPLVVLECPEIKAALDPAVGKPRLLLVDRQDDPPAKEEPPAAQPTTPTPTPAPAVGTNTGEEGDVQPAPAQQQQPTPAAQQEHKAPKEAMKRETFADVGPRRK